jgi:hypothetical protein
MKDTLQELPSYEHVFYTSLCQDSGPKITHHVGTNEYEFEFPGTWRTKSGGSLILGIRALYLKKAYRQLVFAIKLYNFLTGTKYVQHSYCWGPETKVTEVLNNLNDTWQQADLGPFPEQKSVMQWFYEPSERRFVFHEKQNAYSTNVDFDVVPEPSEVFTFGHFDYKTNPRPYVGMGWNREDLLVCADFIDQTENQHLGYTGTEFPNPKKYNIIRNTPKFMINLWEDATGNPVELPADKKDYVVIEAIVYRDANV